jgi:ADP-heptose:LPS heptosyltransferase
VKALDAVGRLAVRGRRGAASRAEARPDAVRSILVVEFWNIGDVVLAMPFLAQLRAIFPGATVTLLAQPHAAEIFRNSDLVDDVVTADFPWTASARKYDPRRYDRAALRRLFRELRERRFDIAFESRMDPRAKIVLALTGARRRVAFDYGGGEWLLTDPVPVGTLDRHRVDDWLRLLRPFGEPGAVRPPRLTVTGVEAARAREWLAARGIRPGDRVVAVHPGASNAGKRWPLDGFEGVVDAIVREGIARVVAIEDPSGYGSGLAAIRGVSAIRPGLRELIALLAEVEALVCNDSGPMHLAAAVGTPTVGIFHRHAAREFAPFGDGHRLLQPRPEREATGVPSAEALLDVTVPEVVAALKDSLAVPAGRQICATGS